MNKVFHNLIGEFARLELSGKHFVIGKVVDIGIDLIVVCRGADYIYIPLLHMKNIRIAEKDEMDMELQESLPGIVLEENLSLRKVLNNAKGMFVELYVTGNEAIHGYITSILNNYFVFYSPIYKTMYIPLNHFKWLIPYQSNQRPYGLNNQEFPVRPISAAVARSFEVQIEKLKNKLVIFNLGENGAVIGKLNGVVDNMVELETAREKILYLNLQHIKTVHMIS
ncbi:MAG: DUF2642 domain-containing protein [Bacillus sp. (in: firmicutes)]